MADPKRTFRHSDTASDSEGSEEDCVSLASSAVESSSVTLALGRSDAPGVTSAPSSAPLTKGPGKKRSRKSRQEWDIVEGLKGGNRCQDKPERFQGFLMKRRKWPMKGWHKRYFVLERGILTYTKSPADMQKGKYHGIIDIGLAVIAYKRQGERIDIDAEEQIHHIKVKDRSVFDDWLKRLRHHRLYRQDEISHGMTDLTPPTAAHPSSIGTIRRDSCRSPTEEITPLANANLHQTLKRGGDVIRSSSFKASQGRVMAWILDNNGSEQCEKNLSTCQTDLTEIRELLDRIQALPISTDTSLELTGHMEAEKVLAKKRGFRQKRRERKSDSYAGSAVLKDHIQVSMATTGNQQASSSSSSSLLPTPSEDRLHSSASNPNLLNFVNTNGGGSSGSNSSIAANTNNSSSTVSGSNHHNLHQQHIHHHQQQQQAAPSVFVSQLSHGGKGSTNTQGLHESRIREIKLRESFVSKATKVHSHLRELHTLLSSQRDRLRQWMEQEATLDTGPAAVINLKHSVSELQKQNTELRARLAKIHADSTPLPEPAPLPYMMPPTPTMHYNRSTDRNPLGQSLSMDSFSMSEYYDAEENIETISDSSSEPSDEEVSSDVSEDGNDTDHTAGGISVSEVPSQSICATGRRTKLPVPKPESPDVSLWNLLYRNIGKDLTKISMPVTLNEPLSMLQRLCEELEYSELLDKASEYDDPYERMIYIAAFAVSSYASSYYREGHKPFNPLLGETYEAIREDKGWRFVAEQVSHHPPISACYCESRNFTFWQDVRIRTKFWGKSMEIQPLGHVHVLLPKYREHYKWNKVTTCVHNLLGGQRWADQYGEMTITNNNIVCKLTFTKGVNSSSAKRYEVFGNIGTSDGKVVHNLFGKWNEAFFCGHASSAKCVWRPGSMPEDYELYYGFTRFAMELNELDPDMSKFLPLTDTRFRPDQRLLEEGKIQEAEAEKHRLENTQRDRRKKREVSKGDDTQPMWFRKVHSEGKETYEYTKKYWEARTDPGFGRMSFLPLY